ncbi:hypothetical protein SAMN05421810_10163 [Amycolatopsis arida]|uniref:Holin n=1 Tax=Amycolatopsis arida TaxID=587909 RepID=A0A1I5KBK8_9PSEU|nr:hypothetical protein [Amycolatopsis arida]TDX96959.1 hypothetical protein CLV69_10261 [Amycolatopsis arida]SFO81976.1 hypothetical protein SAMN05421810_10163 [Amycolatopsis arida]
MDVPDRRPRPIRDTIRSGGAWRTAIGALITAAVSFGLLNTEQATLVDNIVATLATLITLVTSLIAQFHILGRAEPQVTPVSDPRDDHGAPLVPAPPPPDPPPAG